MNEEKILLEIVKNLNDLGIKSYYEYPGFLQIPLKDGWNLNFGFANAPLFTWDITNDDGEVAYIDIDSVDIRTDSSIKELTDYAAAVYRMKVNEKME